MIENQSNSSPVSSLFVVTCLLAVIVGGIALRVEVLNAQVGFYLPRGAEDVGKWRWSSTNDEMIRARMGLLYDQDGNILTRELTAEESVQADEIRRKLERENALHEWIRFPGLLQYLLLPALAICILVSLATNPSKRKVVVVCVIAVIGGAAGFSLFYRDYFGSLGA